MAFLNRKSLSKIADEANVKPHSLFEVCEPSVDVLMAYLQGCVLAVLINDENISESDHRKLNILGASLKLSQDDIDLCIKTVENLSSDQEKEEFVSECLALLKTNGVPHYFMHDFQSFLDFSSNSESTAYVDDFGSILFADRDWKSIDEKQFKALQEEKNAQKSEQETQLFLLDMNKQLASLESKEVLDYKDIELLSKHIHSQSYKAIGVTPVKHEMLEATDNERQIWRRMMFLGLFLGKIRNEEELNGISEMCIFQRTATALLGRATYMQESQTMDRQRMLELLTEWGFLSM
ncbi:MAG: hypothetical protein WCT05_04810 [Lentisphaeria bacterium]